MILLAKSPKQGGLLLQEHTQHVIEAIQIMAKAYGFDVQVARFGAILHDLGKGHPAFQAMLLEKESKEKRKILLQQIPAANAIEEELFYRENGQALPHRHELSSLLFLSLFEKYLWPSLVDLVAAHHKSILGDKSRRGLIDLVKDSSFEEVFERHAEAWEEWSPIAIDIAFDFGIEKKSITLKEAREAFQYALDYVKNRPDGWSSWKGLLIGADHFASAYMHDTLKTAEKLYYPPDIATFKERVKSPLAYLYPLSQKRVDIDKPHTLVVAPTGAGKTDFLIRRCKGRIFYTLPFQASINAMYKRIERDIPGYDIRRLHAASRIELDDESEEDVELQLHPGASVKVMTPHQLASIVFGTPRHEAMALDLQGQDVILDEIHTYDSLARAMVVQIVRTLVQLKCRIHIGSATIPKDLADKLIEVMGGKEQVYKVKLSDKQLDTFNRHIVHLEDDELAARAIIKQAIEDREHILFVSNTVDRAQERFMWVKKEFPDLPSLLIHSRFKRGERRTLEQKVEELQDIEGPCIVCATQVIEVSLDISFDRMITDAAPIDALVQRFGRVNRKRNDYTIGKFKPVHVIKYSENEKDIKPYDASIVRTTYNVLPNGEVLRESKIQELINKVYPIIEIPDAATFFIMNPDGSYRIKELQHRKKSVIVEALKIDSVICILQSDVKEYSQAHWEDRVKQEIPVSYRLRFAMKHCGEPLTIGSYPYVIPDALYNPDNIPLGLRIEPKENNDANLNIQSRMK